MTRTRKAILAISAIAFLCLITWGIFVERPPQYHPYAVFQASDVLQVHFLKEASPSLAVCESTTKSITQAMLSFCPECQLVQSRCLDQLNPRQRMLLSGSAVDVPVMHFAGGVVAFDAMAPHLAAETCAASKRFTSETVSGNAECTTIDPIKLASLLVAAKKTQASFTPSAGTLAALTLVATFISYVLCWLIIKSQRWHGRFSHDGVNSGPQKFHAAPVPRIGGLAIAAGVGGTLIWLTTSDALNTSTAYGFSMLALAAVPAFAGGFAEDLTKKVGVLARLMLTIAAGVIAALLIGATLDRLDVPGLDILLAWPLFAIAFTAFAVGGVANAINIIDGYHGLVAGYAIIVLAALAGVSAQVGDQVVLVASLAMMGALAGFFIWNYPKGMIFLGDGGAYLLGFWLSELAVLLVVRNPDVSPWFPLVLLAYPIFETLYSIYRRSFKRGHGSGRPDALHLHQLIYKRLIRIAVGSKNPVQRTRRNSMVGRYIWFGTALFIVPSLLFKSNSYCLMGLALLFAISYTWLYGRLTSWHSPVRLISVEPQSGGGIKHNKVLLTETPAVQHLDRN